MNLINTFNKKYLLILTPILLFLTLTVSLFSSTIQIRLNDNLLQTNISPIEQNGTTLVPLRVISENLGCNVSFDNQTQKITITKDSYTITLTLGKTTALVQGVTKSLGISPKVINNTTMVPLRFIGKNLNCDVNWDSHSKTVLITTHSNTSSSINFSLPIATLVIKNYGTVTLELYPDMAPNTVNNFIFLANSGYYNGLTFHRIISDFMIQGGDPTGTGSGGPGYAINGEFASNGFTQNTLSHTKGIISMARTYRPNSAGSQFFIMSADGTYLDGDYAAFGKVTSGIEIIERLQDVATNNYDAPIKPVIIESLHVNTQGINYPAPEKVKQ